MSHKIAANSSDKENRNKDPDDIFLVKLTRRWEQVGDGFSDNHKIENYTHPDRNFAKLDIHVLPEKNACQEHRKQMNHHMCKDDSSTVLQVNLIERFKFNIPVD